MYFRTGHCHCPFLGITGFMKAVSVFPEKDILDAFSTYMTKKVGFVFCFQELDKNVIFNKIKKVKNTLSKIICVYLTISNQDVLILSWFNSCIQFWLTDAVFVETKLNLLLIQNVFPKKQFDPCSRMTTQMKLKCYSILGISLDQIFQLLVNMSFSLLYI